MNCKKCGSLARKDGIIKRSTYNVQQFKCTNKDCRYSWTEKIETPKIIGIMPEDKVDFETEIMPYLIKVGERAKEKNKAETNQVITMPNKPFAIALLADIHGGGKVDYKTLQEDVNIIAETDGMYVGNVGDNIDNFIIGVLQAIQREQSTTFQMEQRFLDWLFTKLRGSLLFWCSGNHENWTKKISGIDSIKETLKGTYCLYDRTQILFDLQWGENKQTWLVRHKWKYSSIYNATHGLEVGWERVGLNFDVSVGGHTHIATLCRPFIREDKMRYAILLGTYKIRDTFGREYGFAKSHGLGSGAMVYNPDGRSFWCEDLLTARDLLKVWQKQYEMATA
jgi:predicted MPP superfamily phosphohydrolase